MKFFNMMRVAMLLASLVLISNVSLAAEEVQTEPVKLLPGPFEFPAAIGKLSFIGPPHKYEDPRGGISYAYNAPGMSMTVYVYDAGVKDIPDGGNTNLVCQLSESAKHEIESTSNYQNKVLKSEQMVRLNDASGEPMIRETMYEFDVGDSHRISYLWITGAARQFVKLRFTAASQLAGELPDLRRSILSALISAVQPHIKLADGDAKSNGNSINISMDSSAMDDGFMYLTLLGALADKDPDGNPKCGGEYVPGFQNDYGAYQALLQFNEKGGSTFVKQLRKANEAGYLAEFVWVKLHREDWGVTPPDNLKLAEFDGWQKKQLKKFERPYFGSVGVNHPRPLPVVSLQRQEVR